MKNRARLLKREQIFIRNRFFFCCEAKHHIFLFFEKTRKGNTPIRRLHGSSGFSRV